MRQHGTIAGAGEVDRPEGWAVDTSLGQRPGIDAGAAHRVLDAAVAIVWEATCRRFPGQVTAIVRYCGPATRELPLGRAFAYPVLTVDAIRQVDPAGQVVAMPQWWFQRPDLLLRTWQPEQAVSRFPCQDRFRPLDTPGTWWIEATVGADPPPEVLNAASVMARELWLAETDPESCSLPDKVQSITRQGTTIAFDRSQWAGVPLMAEISQPYPKGWGCSPGDFTFMSDPAAARSPWMELAAGDLPT